MNKKMTLLFLSVMFLFCSCSKKNERMLKAEERYKDCPLHLLALEHKCIDGNENLGLSLINESVHGHPPLKLLAEYQWQYSRLKKENP